jgi:hypothetical protein
VFAFRLTVRSADKGAYDLMANVERDRSDL